MSDVMRAIIANLGGIVEEELDDLDGVESFVLTRGGEWFVVSLGGTYFEVRGWHPSLQRPTTHRLLHGDLADPKFGVALEAARLSELYAAGESLPDD